MQAIRTLLAITITATVLVVAFSTDPLYVLFFEQSGLNKELTLHADHFSDLSLLFADSWVRYIEKHGQSAS